MTARALSSLLAVAFVAVILSGCLSGDETLPADPDLASAAECSEHATDCVPTTAAAGEWRITNLGAAAAWGAGGTLMEVHERSFVFPAR